MRNMAARAGIIRNGQVVLDNPVDLPDGTPIALVPVNDEAQVDDAERARKSAALQRAWAQVQAGKGISGEEFLKKLKSK